MAATPSYYPLIFFFSSSLFFRSVKMSSCSSLTLFLHPRPLPLLRPHHLHHHVTPRFAFKSRIHFSLSSSSFSDEDESRWQREEQRWLREEQRWLREEQRWARDRDALLREIVDLKLQIHSLQTRPGSDTIPSIAGLLQTTTNSLNKNNKIPESGSSSVPLDLGHDDVTVSQPNKETTTTKEVLPTLRKGSEGKTVREMQEALQKLGFYCGDEDVEFSHFSTGTERAVKTWQASVGVTQDGIMTQQLVEKLFLDPRNVPAFEQPNVPTFEQPKEDANRAAATSVTDVSEVKKVAVEDEKAAEVEVAHHRVFLLGENRWEDSSRLIRNKNGTDSKTTGTPTKCLTCRGEGRLLCSECDGTGEPNIEEQFMEWIDDGAKCPYCEGLGYNICDVCGGN